MSKKKYRLGTGMSLKDANRILGLPANTPLTWGVFQHYAKSKNIKQNAQILT